MALHYQNQEINIGTVVWTKLQIWPVFTSTQKSIYNSLKFDHMHDCQGMNFELVEVIQWKSHWGPRKSTGIYPDRDNAGCSWDRKKGRAWISESEEERDFKSG